MVQTLMYPSFNYARCNIRFYSGEAGHLLYPGLRERFIDSVDVTPCSNTNLDPCWLWTGNSQLTLSHKHLNMVKASRIAFAIGFPDEYNAYIALHRYRKRIRFETISRCGNSLCVRPDHLIPTNLPLYRRWLSKPRQRTNRPITDNWLTYPELQYLLALIRIGSGDPEHTAIQYAEHLSLEPLVIFENWDIQCKNFELLYFAAMPIQVCPTHLRSELFMNQTLQ